MSTPTHAPISQAVVHRLREAPDLVAGVKPSIHESFAPEKTPYPLITYNLVYAPYEWDWTSPTLVGGYDIAAFSRNSVEADNLDAAIADRLSDQPLDVDGQRLLYCRRVAGLPTAVDLDDDGKKVYRAGGTYEIWTTPYRVVTVGVSDDAPASDAM